MWLYSYLCSHVLAGLDAYYLQKQSQAPQHQYTLNFIPIQGRNYQWGRWGSRPYAIWHIYNLIRLNYGKNVSPARYI